MIEEREPLFVNEQGKRLSDRGMRYLVAKYASKDNLGEVSPHTLRHSFCKNLADQRYGLQIIAQLARHESLETTKRYIRPGDAELRKAVQTISEKR